MMAKVEGEVRLPDRSDRLQGGVQEQDNKSSHSAGGCLVLLWACQSQEISSGTQQDLQLFDVQGSPWEDREVQ